MPHSSDTMSDDATAITDAERMPPCLTGMMEAPCETPDGVSMVAVIPSGAPWPKSTLRVGFLDPEPFQFARFQILWIAREWCIDTGVSFVWAHDPATADIRVSHRQVGAYWSYVGAGAAMIPSPQPTMNLGFHASNKVHHWDDILERRRLILHEFGHALGLAHEHQHPESQLNVEAAVNWYAPYFPGLSRAAVRDQFERFKAREIDRRSTKFDARSVMLYSFPASIWPPRGITAPALISDTDRAAIRSLYGAI